jgi:hypothetical protein
MPRARPPQPSRPLLGRVDFTRLILAGLAAGMVINIGEFLLNGAIMPEEWDAAMQSLNRSPIGGARIVWLTIMSFVLGVIVMSTYVMIKPALGADRRPAIVAALIAWALAYGLGFGWSFAMGLFSAKIYLLTLGWALVEIVFAATAGAWYYERTSPQDPSSDQPL